MASGETVEEDGLRRELGAVNYRTTALILAANEAGFPIVFVSDGFESLTGHRATDALGRRLNSLGAPKTSRRAIDALDRALRDEREVRLRLQQYRPDGSEFWSDLTVSPLRDAAGLISHFLVVLVDVGEIAETEESLRRNLESISRAMFEWESAVDVLREIVLVVDDDMQILRANRSIEEWELGTVRESAGLDAHRMLHAGCHVVSCYLMQLWDRLREAPERQVSCNVMDERLRRRVQVTMYAIGSSESGGQFESATIVLRDVSEIHRREEESRRRDRFESMGYLVGGLAHEIGNPLAAMKTTIDVWKEGFERFDREAHFRYLARVDQGVKRLLAVVKRIQGDDAQLLQKDGVVPIGPQLSRLAELFDDQLREQGVTLSVAPLPDPDACLLGDATAVDQILANVVKNAIEACSPSDRIEIEVKDNSEFVAICVRDTGGGITHVDMEKIFVPFYTTKATGTGIGLAHVNHLMEAMGGEVQIESAENKGTNVTLQFRRATGATDAAAS